MSRMFKHSSSELRCHVKKVGTFKVSIHSSTQNGGQDLNKSFKSGVNPNLKVTKSDLKSLAWLGDQA